MEFELFSQRTDKVKEEYPQIFEWFGYVETIVKDRYGIERFNYRITISKIEDLKKIADYTVSNLEIDFNLMQITILG